MFNIFNIFNIWLNIFCKLVLTNDEKENAPKVLHLQLFQLVEFLHLGIISLRCAASLLNFSTITLIYFCCPFYSVVHCEHWLRRFFFYRFSHCTCSQMHKLITIIYHILRSFVSPQLWVVASVWQGIGSCELRRLDPEQLLHYVTLKDARWKVGRPNIIAVWQPLNNRCTAPNQIHWQLQVQVQNCANP